MFIAQAPPDRLNSFEQQLQFCDVQLLVPGLQPVADKAPSLQALGPHTEAATVPVQGLEIVPESCDIMHLSSRVLEALRS